jgi:hypothetical protein
VQAGGCEMAVDSRWAPPRNTHLAATVSCLQGLLSGRGMRATGSALLCGCCLRPAAAPTPQHCRRAATVCMLLVCRCCSWMCVSAWHSTAHTGEQGSTCT